MTRERMVDLALLSVRVGLGLLFLTFALEKFANPARTAKQIVDSNMLTSPWLELYAAGLPWWELAFGICFLLGIVTRIAGGAAFLALASYTIYLGAVANPQYPFFGVNALGILDRNVPLMFAALALALAGAGAYSIDAWLTHRRGVTRERPLSSSAVAHSRDP